MENKKEIVLTTHARERMEERKIPQVKLIDVVERGIIIGHRDDKEVKELKGLIVVCKEEKEKIVVITVFTANRPFERRIRKIAPDGQWWHKHNLTTFIQQGYFLVEKGLSEDEVVEHLAIIEAAVSSEFGE